MIPMDANDIAAITRSATDACTDYLRNAILDGQFSQGEPIVIDRLVVQLGVSHTPIREAIRRLEAEGFLSYVPKRGATVRPIDPNEFEELVEIRKALEPVALLKSIPNATKKQNKSAEEAFNYWTEQTDPTIILNSQWRFYAEIYTPAQQPRILELIASNWKHIHRYHRIAWDMSEEVRKKDIRMMRALFERYRIKDTDGAHKALLAVINWGKSIVIKSL